MNLFNVYRSYPFQVPLRVKFFNLFRMFFRLPGLEQFLVARIISGHRYWRKLIPPLYFYPDNSFRDAERDGTLYRLDISKELEHSVYFCSVCDVAWSNLLQRLTHNKTIIDVGANIGYLTLKFARTAKDGVVHAFEPDSETFQKLLHNIAINGLANVHIYQTALGADVRIGRLFRLFRNNPGTNRILPEKPASALSSEKVEIITLDSFLERGYFPSGVDLIKIDVEGFELFVLQGALKTIQHFRPELFIELIDENLALNGSSGQAVVEFVKRLGYLVLDAKTMKPLVRADRYYTDILCLPRQLKP